jgi:glc operon protein GlcG
METEMRIGVPRATLSIDAIQAMLNAAVARAKALDVKLHITIVDHAANLAGFISFPGAPRIAETTANRKAFTAVNTGMPTHVWEAYVNSIPASELKIIDSIPGYVAAKGGYPIIENGLVLGGIGVSGANQEIDGDVAEAALAAIGLLVTDRVAAP